jgi:hypothetical protein
LAFLICAGPRALSSNLAKAHGPGQTKYIETIVEIERRSPAVVPEQTHTASAANESR